MSDKEWFPKVEGGAMVTSTPVTTKPKRSSIRDSLSSASQSLGHESNSYANEFLREVEVTDDEDSSSSDEEEIEASMNHGSESRESVEGVEDSIVSEVADSLSPMSIRDPDSPDLPSYNRNNDRSRSFLGPRFKESVGSSQSSPQRTLLEKVLKKQSHDESKRLRDESSNSLSDGWKMAPAEKKHFPDLDSPQFTKPRQSLAAAVIDSSDEENDAPIPKPQKKKDFARIKLDDSVFDAGSSDDSSAKSSPQNKPQTPKKIIVISSEDEDVWDGNESVEDKKSFEDIHDESRNSSDDSFIDDDKSSGEEEGSSPESSASLIEDPDLRRELEAKLERRKKVLTSSDLTSYPDNGKSLKREVRDIEKQLAGIAPLKSHDEGACGTSVGTVVSRESDDVQVVEKDPNKPPDLNRDLWERQFAPHPVVRRLYGGQATEQKMREAHVVIRQMTQVIHQAISSCPDEQTESEDPSGVKIKLMAHQRQGLAWMQWREMQVPPGGILADDMGLGKTLSMISLILKQKQKRIKDRDEGVKPGKGNELKERVIRIEGLIPSKATLIVCPASVVKQWEAEIENRLKPGRLQVFMFHGPRRQISAQRMAKYDVVLTTYGTVSSEIPPEKVADIDGGKTPEKKKGKDGGPSNLIQIAWDRVILDEAHNIKNHTSKQSRACCRIPAASRWALTGTPIHNDLKDLFALVRFLRVAPFDELAVWHSYIKSGTRDRPQTEQQKKRLDAIVKSLLLRRTKAQKCAITNETIVKLPDMNYVEVELNMDDREKEIYEVMFAHARERLQNFMKSDAQKERELVSISSGTATQEQHGYRNPFKKKSRNHTEMTNPQSDFQKMQEILVLLLRLRQACVHLSLTKEAIDMEAFSNETSTEDKGSIGALSERMGDMSVDEGALLGSLTEMDATTNRAELFEIPYPSTKIKALMEEIKRIGEPKQSDSGLGKQFDKCIVVSQWVGLLEVVNYHLEKERIKVTWITGKVPVTQRQAIVEDFNAANRGARVLLLSLTAGGVGLNLVGGNHLFLLDLHWNPFLEKQACDRIYRMGQKKEVFIHKLICKDTFEANVLALQKKKLELADSVLHGGGAKSLNKLSLADLRFIFELDKKPTIPPKAATAAVASHPQAPISPPKWDPRANAFAPSSSHHKTHTELEHEKKVQQLTDMGVDRRVAISSLQATFGDIKAAISSLFGYE